MSKRSIKIGGVTTSLFLEDAFWREIEIRGEKRGLTASQYLRDLLGHFETGSNRSAAIKELLMSSLREEYDELVKKNEVGIRSRWLVENSGARVRLDFNQERIRVGSDRDNDIVLNDPEVEAHHAMLVYDGKRWWGFDLNSRDGIKLNNKETRASTLPRRSELSLGNTQIIKV